AITTISSTSPITAPAIISANLIGQRIGKNQTSNVFTALIHNLGAVVITAAHSTNGSHIIPSAAATPSGEVRP
ncbi:hypothetical protein GWI33_013574, partial [Rhynchophorus ferrugineus]